MGDEISPTIPYENLFNVRGKTAICTGTTGGLGRELCAALAANGVSIVSIEMKGDPNSASIEDFIRRLGCEFHRFECDISNSKDLRSTFADIWKSGIIPDILLNAAGIDRRGPAVDFTDETIDAVLSTNLKGSFVAAQEFAKELLRLKRPGKIVNIGSMLSFVGMYNSSAYAASKGAVLQMTKAFSNEWARHEIQVNCICPGYFHTPLTTSLIDDIEYNNFIISRTPAGRWGNPGDLCGAILFLASAASNYVTGTSIVVDGGFLGK